MSNHSVGAAHGRCRIDTVDEMLLAARTLVAAAAVAAMATACGSDAPDTDTTATLPAGTDAATAETAADAGEEQRFPDIVAATARETNGVWTFDVTVSSPYDSPERYADGWRIIGPDGTEYGFRLLTHDHAAEQPFTRSLSNVEIPADVDIVTIEGRDQVHGFGGSTFDLTLPRG